MKKLPLFLLALSLAANVALLLRPSSPPEQIASMPTAQSVAANASESARVTHADTGLSAGEEAALQQARQLLATDDLPALVARLRAAGFSSMDIRGIVSARLAERYGAARVAATAHLEVVPYWQSNSSFPRDPATGSEVRRLFRAQDREMKKLLGPDARATDDWSQMLHDRQWGYLPPDKVELLNDILDDYKEIQQSVWSASRGIFTAADGDRIALIEAEKRADIAALLTSEELEAYDMHTGPIANQLRRFMKDFRPSEAEYQAIYRLVADNLEQGANAIRLDQNVIAGSRPGRHQPTDITDQLTSVLPPERVAEFRMLTSNDYIQISRLAEQFDLPATVAKDTTLSQSTAKVSRHHGGPNTLSPPDPLCLASWCGISAQSKVKSGPRLY
ncbi:MAG: hypothetical protein H7A44_13860 [Opitutaceae bacterium]|nr:hypothetical protein [Opitutaceae bacterium]